MDEEITITLTKSQCKNIAEFIEFNIFENIRNDDEIDNILWLVGMMDAYYKLKVEAEN